jgi:putative MATE family efflux protein
MFKNLRREPGFYKRLWALALPLVMQNLITTSLGFVDTFMVGLLGNRQLSAVTAANVPIFLLQLVIFGLMSGLAVLVSQYWGQHDIESINRCTGVAMYISFLIAAIFASVLFFASRWVMSIITNNPDLIRLGAPYLRIVGLSYLFNALSSVYAGMQRSTENAKFGMQVFAASMLINTFLNYCLIFGHFGAPALGITGAALATFASRVAEFLIVVVYAARDRRVPLMPRALFHPGAAIAKSTFRYSGPVIINESMWGLGTSVMTAIMGHMTISTDMLAAYAIMGNIDKFATVACFGLSGATAILMGKTIGEGQSREKIYSLGSCLLTLSALNGVVISVCLAILLPTFFIPVIYPLFKLSPQATHIAVMMCIVYLCVMPVRAFDVTNVTGVLRSGGDTKVAAVLDLFPLWLAAIPLTALTALVLHSPVSLVCVATQAENFFKILPGILRLRSRKWINDVTIHREEPSA